MTSKDNYSLLGHNTFLFNVVADKFVEYNSIVELIRLVPQLAGQKWLHIGQGSNLLFLHDFHGMVLHSAIRGIEVLERKKGTVLLRVGAGEVLDELCEWCAKQGWGGIENLSNIPGEVGAGAVQNVGAYGVELCDVIERVEAYDLQRDQFELLKKEECNYGYRDSLFKHENGRYIITAVLLRLQTEPVLHLDYGNIRAALSEVAAPTVMDVRRAVIAIRGQKLPRVGEIGSAGSFFKNPVISQQQYELLQQQYPQMPHYMTDDGVKIPAAWLIEQCGLKGARHGGAQVFERQPLVIVNTGHAQPDDVRALAQRVIDRVQEKFSIQLRPEVNYIA